MHSRLRRALTVAVIAPLALGGAVALTSPASAQTGGLPATTTPETPTYYRNGECGLVQFNAPPDRTTLVVEYQGRVLTAGPDDGLITLDPEEYNVAYDVSWRIFGGPERDWDVPSWNGYGEPGFGDRVKLYGDEQGGYDWTLGGTADPNPFTTWNTFTIKNRCKTPVTPGDPVVNPATECDGVATLTVPIIEGVRYEVYEFLAEGEGDWGRVDPDGETETFEILPEWIDPGDHPKSQQAGSIWVRAKAERGYKLEGKRSWWIPVPPSDVCATPIEPTVQLQGSCDESGYVIVDATEGVAYFTRDGDGELSEQPLEPGVAHHLTGEWTIVAQPLDGYSFMVDPAPVTEWTYTFTDGEPCPVDPTDPPVDPTDPPSTEPPGVGGSTGGGSGLPLTGVGLLRLVGGGLLITALGALSLVGATWWRRRNQLGVAEDLTA